MDCSNSVVYNSFTRKYSIISSSNHDNIGSNDTHDFLEKGIIVNSESDEYSNLVSSIQEEVKNGPQTLTIFPTTDCNARCWYCYERRYCSFLYVIGNYIQCYYIRKKDI